jgi:acyl-CoA reductase-like NAD-dependent aldehyde dehydrogenase
MFGVFKNKAPPQASAEPAPQGRDTMSQTAAMLIDGARVGAAKSYDKLNPVTGALVGAVAAASIEDAHKAVDAAGRAFPVWAGMKPGERRALLNKAADLLHARAKDLIGIASQETGATPLWVGFNVHLAENMLREAAAQVYALKGAIIPSDHAGVTAMAIRQPVGVVLGIAPWNAPVILAVRAVAMPLALGNTVILKASEECPLTHLALGQIFQDAGLPPGVVNVVTNAPVDASAIVGALIAHPAVRRINFTGSTRVGRVIAETAAKHLKPVLLELGGKAPLVVLDDADLDAAAAAANFGAFLNAGQICMSTERLVIDRKIADAFVEKLAARAANLKLGAPNEEGVTIGPVVSAAAARKLKELLDDAVAKGARVAFGGDIKDGVLVPPTLLVGITREMRIYAEESFGPVKGVVLVDSEAEALKVANDTEYGLSAAVFTKDVDRGLAFARRIESGICHINGPTVQDEAQMPFGGVKASGYGRFGGQAAVAEFTDLRWVTIQSGPRGYPI